MTTLIAVYNSEGCVGRCDAKCYNATGHDCDCICGGMNHGGGLNQAIENTRELAETWVDEANKKRPADDQLTFKLPEKPIQLELAFA